MQPIKQPTRQQQLENQLRYIFMIVQHRIEERNWSEAVQNSIILSKTLMELQKLTVESIQSEEQHEDEA